MQSRTAGKLWLALAAAVFAICLAVAAWARPSAIAQLSQPRPAIHSLAVLPLRNLSGDPAQEYLADGITEAIIGRLATSP